MSLKIIILALLIFTPLSTALAQDTKPAKSASGLPTVADVEASLQRTLGYDPAVNWKILDIGDSPFPGVAEVLVSVNRAQPIHLYMIPGLQYAIIGSMIPFGTNPYAPARARLRAADGPGRGSTSPLIRIVEFVDLQCPQCRNAHPILAKLLADFPRAQITFQLYPLPASQHPWAMKGALYADCAGRMDREHFWRYIDLVFENQEVITPATADAKLRELAAAAGLDAPKIAACSALPETAARVRKSLDLGQSLNVTAVPTVFVNGRMVPGIAGIPYEDLKRLVKFEMDHADH
jgi:protein-disulfide isomerase